MSGEDAVPLVSPQGVATQERQPLAAQREHAGRVGDTGPRVRGQRAAAERTPEPAAPYQEVSELNVSRGTCGLQNYKSGRCKCTVCTAAATRSVKIWRVRVARGVQFWADAAPVREHVRALIAAGMSARVICRVARVSTSVLQRLLYSDPPIDRLTAATAERVMATEFDIWEVSEVASVDATGARRRIQALAVAGWSLPKQAAEIGISAQYMGHYARADRLAAGTVRKIMRAYPRLCATLPPQGTRFDRMAVSRTRTMAAARGWAGIGAWDERAIDDPDAGPARSDEVDTPLDRYDEVVVAGALAGRARLRELTEPERVELARRWEQRGGTVTGLSKLMHCSGAIAQKYADLAQPDEQRKSA